MTQDRITLVVTKPKLANAESISGSDPYATLSKQAHFDALFFPIFELTSRQETDQVLQRFATPDSQEKRKIIVFVSPSALTFGMRVLKTWPVDVACGVMGSQSANLALQLGVPEAAILAPQFSDESVSEDSEGLYEILTKQYKATSSDILICKGPLGRSSFHEKLTASGYSVQLLETYNREPAAHEPQEIEYLLNISGKVVLWITSSESVKVLERLINQFNDEKAQSFKNTAQVLVTHPRIKAAAIECGFQKVIQVRTGIQSVLDWIADQSDLVSKPSDQTATNNSYQTPAATMTENASSTSRPKGSYLSVVLACIAILSVLALAFIGQNRLEQAKQVVGERLQSEKTRVKILEEKLDKTEGLYRDLKAKFDLLDAAQKEAAGQQATLEAVYKELVASRAAVSLSEIEQLISIAKRQLFVLGNLDGAKVALRQAVQLLSKTEQPSLIGLRTSIEKDLAELNAVKEVDLLSLAIELDSIIDSVDTMPTLAGADASKDMTLAELSHGGPGKERIDPVQHNPNFLQMTFGAIGGFFVAIWEDIKSLVEITKVDKPEVLQLSADQQTDLRNTLRLSILNARLSLLSRHSELLQSDINRSRAITSIYFDQKNPQVKRALKVLEKIGQIQLAIALPDLSNSTTSLNLAKAAEGGSD